MKHKQKKHLRPEAERLFSAFGELDPSLLNEIHSNQPIGHVHRPIIRLCVAVLTVVILLTLVTFTVFAASPTLRGIINFPFLNENAQKDSVPKGWVGVYTVSDLDSIRNDLDAKYILMNDLTFTESDGAFTPIGTQEMPFTGQFDGNGHVIRGPVIDVTQTEPPVVEGTYTTWEGTTSFSYHKVTSMTFVGLFGFCGHSQFENSDRIDSEINDFAFPYLTDEEHYRGMICNLGVEGATVKVKDASNVRVGIIAGQASYVVGCYVENCTIELTAYEAQVEHAHFRLRMGGIAGNVQVLDSCYAQNCKLTVTGANELLSDHLNIDDINSPEKATVFLGGLAGNAYTIVTSYSVGNEITCDYAADRQREWWYEDCPAYVGDLYGHVHRLPFVMNYSHYRGFMQSYYRAVFEIPEEEPLPDDWYSTSRNGSEQNWDFGKLRSYYLEQPLDILMEYFDIDPDHINPAFVTGDFSVETSMYVFDRATHMEELMHIEDLAVHYLGLEGLAEAVAVDNLKVGPIHCYTLDPETNYTKDIFPEFNFKTVWEMKDGRPVLQIFQ